MIYTITLNPAIDRLLYIDGELAKRKKNRIDSVKYDIGGKGIHPSYVLTKLEIENKALGLCGEMNKRTFFQLLHSKQIANNFIEVPNVKTRESYVIIEKNVSGSTMLTEKGFFTPEEIKAEFLRWVEKVVEKEDWVIVAGSLPLNYNLGDLEKLLRLLKSKGCFIACDFAGEALKLAVELEVDFIKPNEFEIQSLLDEQADLDTNLKELSKKVKIIVLSLGGKGSKAIADGFFYKVVSPMVKEVNDTGAGDNFVGAFIGQYYLTKDVEFALKFATATAASKVQHNDSTSFSLDEAQELIKEVGITKTPI